MKMMVAFIQPQQLSAVKRALFKADVKHMTCGNVLGTAPDGAELNDFRGAPHEVPLFQKVRIELALHDEMVDQAVEAVAQGAQESGGFGMVFVSELYQAVNVGTGKQGEDAII